MYHIFFIALMALVVAFIYVDITGGKRPSPKMMKIYLVIFIGSGILALLTYFYF